MASVRQSSRRVAVALFVVCIPFAAFAQFVGRNINMVSGTQLPDGDPYLQRQNEPSMSVSTRNPLHILAGANDYRTVDVPGLPDGEETGDAWLGLFKSTDGGLTWRTTLVPGYPQDISAEGKATPLRNADGTVYFKAAADPMVRSGLNGMFYYSGIALTRTSPIVSAVFVARYNDFNNRESGAEPVHYLGMSMVADGRQGPKFLDKPSLAVDIPRPGAQLCSVSGQFFPAGNVYVVYTDITTSNGTTTGAKLWFSRSTDCGAKWSAPIAISGNNTLNQGSVMAIDTRSGALYVVWRRFAINTETAAILVTKSTDGGKTFSTPVVIRSISPFEQSTQLTRFRAPAYPTAVTDADGRLYVAWAERTGPSGVPVGTERPDGRIMLSNSPDGATWTTPVMVAPTAAASPLSGRGHQFMPALSYASGALMLVHYDLREDSTIGLFSWSQGSPFFTETRALMGDLAKNPQNLNNVFNNFVEDANSLSFGSLLRRHTLDLRATQASPGVMPVFQPSQRVSAYRFGYTSKDKAIRQLEFNPPNYKMFMHGTVPFFGDYIDLAPQYPFISSLFNVPFPAPVFHAVWTDNRDVRPPVAPYTWADFAPPGSTGARSSYDPTQSTSPCVAGNSLTPPPPSGTRNQNIYTSRITAGLFFGSPGNAKPLGTIQRAFVVTVQNSKKTAQSYRLQIVNQPPGGKATFQQLPVSAPALTTLDITVNAKSSGSRSVFVTSIYKNAPVGVTVTEIPAVGGAPQPNALLSAAVLNPDPSSPDIGTPTPGTPDIGTAEVYTPDIGTPDIGTPDIGTPDIGTPDIGTPDIGTPDIGTPDIGTPDIGTPTYASPDIGTPDIGTPDIGTNSVTDTTWPVVNSGNTTSSYSTKLLQTGVIPPGLKLQLILHQSYRTPVDHNCVLATETHHILLNNVSNPTVLTSTAGIGTPDIGTPAVPTVSIAPGESVNLTVRVVDPVHTNRVIPATSFLTPVIIAHAVNTADLRSGNLQPAISLVIATSIPDGVVGIEGGGTPYNFTMQAIGGVPGYRWALLPPPCCDERFISGPPAGVTFDAPTATFSGRATATGRYRFIIMVTDAANHSVTRLYTVNITNPLRLATTSAPSAVQGTPYSTRLASTGGLAPIQWEVSSGSLPAGLTLSRDGTISGTPTTVGSSFFKVRITDSSVPPQTEESLANLQLDVIPPTGCGSTVTLLFDNWNINGVSNGGTSPTISTSGQWYCVDSISNYHWNNGVGSTPGTIGLTELYRDRTGTLGPWAATGSGAGSYVNWTAAGPSRAPAILRPGATYTVNDSDPATWSQNTASGGKGFTKIYVRTYTPPTYSTTAHLKFNTSPLVPTTAPEMFVLNYDTSTYPAVNFSWSADTVTIPGLAPGHYVVEVASKEAAQAKYYPGGYFYQQVFDVVGPDGNFDVPMTRLIHVKTPADNATTFAAFSCPPSLSVRPVDISWDPIGIAGATYTYRVDKMNCDGTGVPGPSGSTANTSVPLTLAPTGTGEYYTIHLYAYSPAQTYIGQIMSVGTNWYGWDVRFTVP